MMRMVMVTVVNDVNTVHALKVDECKHIDSHTALQGFRSAVDAHKMESVALCRFS